MDNRPNYCEDSVPVETPVGTFAIPKGPLTGPDTLPVGLKERTWGVGAMAATGFAMNIGIPLFMIGALGVGALGLAWWQDLVIGFLAVMFMGFLYMVNGQAGEKLGISYGVQLRSSFGVVVGARVATILRAVIGLMWYGINSWLAALAIDLIFSALSSDYATTLTSWGRTFIWYLIFTGIQYAFLHFEYTGIRILNILGGPICLITIVIAIIWVYVSEGTLGPIFDGPEYASPAGLAASLAYASMVMGTISTLWINYSDISRVVQSRVANVVGMLLAFPLGFVAASILGIIAGSIMLHWGAGFEWNIVLWMSHYPNLGLAVIMLILVIFASATTNPAWNLIAVATTLTNLAPRRISLRKGFIIGSLLSIPTFPWYILSGAGTTFMTWLNYYGAMLGSIAGIMVVDWYFLRGRGTKVDVAELYNPDGIYKYWHGGINWFAIVALASGMVSGYLIDVSHAWFIGTPIAMLVYAGLMSGPGRYLALVQRGLTGGHAINN